MSLPLMMGFVPTEYLDPLFVHPLSFRGRFGQKRRRRQTTNVLNHCLAPFAKVTANHIESQRPIVWSAATGEATDKFWRCRLATAHPHVQMPIIGGTNVH